VNNQGSAEGKTCEFTTVFQPDEDFETGMFKSSTAWISEGGNWTIDGNEAFDGDFSGRSGQIPDNGFSTLKYTCEVSACDFVSFWRKTSTEGEKDKLSFYIDGQVAGEWSGETPWGRELFTVSAGTHEFEWRYSKDVNNNNGSDAVWLDDIHLPIHSAMAVTVNPAGNVCNGAAFVPESNANNYSSVTWQTNGDGSFDDNNLLQPQYTPGPMDQQNGNFLLTMNVHGYEGCADFSGLVIGTVNPVPEIMLPSDTLAGDDGTLFLDGTCENGVSYEWQQPAVASPYINVDESSAVEGKTELTLKVTNSFGCSSEKTVTVHFVERSDKPSFEIYPNPCTDYFTIQPDNGFMPLNRLYMVNAQGAILWQENSEMTINGSSTFDIPQLASGLYMLVAETTGGSVAQPILINP
ncbi:MAG TPA: T9SS type A sorting domain-containing protein, partial [Bacteroidales bacterium]|nr:T9SS type A sorting domain-containing protein [Bacteroidales bacterium]